MWLSENASECSGGTLSRGKSEDGWVQSVDKRPRSSNKNSEHSARFSVCIHLSLGQSDETGHLSTDITHPLAGPVFGTMIRTNS